MPHNGQDDLRRLRICSPPRGGDVVALYWVAALLTAVVLALAEVMPARLPR